MPEFRKYEVEYRMLPLAAVEADQDQPRQDLVPRHARDRLLSSVRQFGIGLPIAVRLAQTGQYIIINGHRRYECAKKLELETIPCLIFHNLKDADVETVRFELQTNQRLWKPLEKADALCRIKEHKRLDTPEKLAKYLALSPSTVRTSLELRTRALPVLTSWNEYSLHESYQQELVRLRTKVRKVGTFEVTKIYEILLEKAQRKTIRNAKEFRKVRKIFEKATFCAAEIVSFLDNIEMTVPELEACVKLHELSELAKRLVALLSGKLEQGQTLSDIENSHLRPVKELLETLLPASA